MSDLVAGRVAEFLLYQAEDGRTRIEVRFDGEMAWLSMGQMAELFQRDKSVIFRHIANVFEEGELDRAAVVAKIATTAADGKTYQVEFFNLDVIISVGYRVKSHRGTQFRIWATQRLREYLIKGKCSGARCSTSTRRASTNMGLTSWAGPVPRKADAVIAKNYLDADELDALNKIVNAHLEFAEVRALNRRPMYMADWIAKLDEFLKLADRDVLAHAGSISHAEAVQKAELEFETYAAERRALPSPVEKHFEEAVKNVKQLERVRREKPPVRKPSKPRRGR